MAKLIFGNDCVSTLAGNVLAAATTITLASGGGSEFPSPGAGEYFVGEFLDTATGNNFEIVWVTSRSGDVLTVLRGQEGTTAQNWLSGDIFAATWTAGQAAAMLQQGESQAQATNYGVDAGTANAYVVTLDPPVASYTAGLPVRVKIANSSSGTSTLNAGGGVRTIKHPDGTNIGTGELLAGGVYEFVYDGTNFILTSVAWPLPNAGLANMPTARILGRSTAGTGKPEYLTGAQSTAILNAFTVDDGTNPGLKGLVPAPGGGYANLGYILTAAGWALPGVTTTDDGSYFRLGNLLVQWGYKVTTNGSFLFPTPFTNAGTPPNNNIAFIAGNANSQGANVDNAYGYVIDNNGFFLATKASSGSANNYPCYWLAIGS